MQNTLKVPLKEMLKVDLLKEAEILAGVSGMDNEISSVNVIEVPDIADWVRPGEFLLTTAYTFSKDIGKLNYLIPILKEKGVCGLGIKVKRFIEQVPESSIEIANKLNFPIIKIPHDVSYGDLIKQILTQIVGEQTRILEQIQFFNDRIKEIMLRRGGMLNFAELINSVVQAPIAIVDKIFDDHVFYSEDNSWREMIGKGLGSLLSAPEKQRDLLLNEVRTEIDQIEGQSVRRIIIPIFFDNVIYGKIFIWDVNKVIHSKEIFVIESAASLIALHILSRVSLIERENIHRSNFMELLLSDHAESVQKAIADAQYYLFHPDNCHQCVVMRVKSKENLSQTPKKVGEEKLLSMMMLSIMEQIRRDYPRTILSSFKNNQAIFLIDYDNDCNEVQVQKHCQAFMELLLSHARKEKMEELTFIGSGSCVQGYAQLHRSYDEAKQVVRILQNITTNGKHSESFQNLGLLKVLGLPELHDGLIKYSNEVLQPLIDYDKNKDGEMIQTIKTFFDYGGNLKKVSEVMFTHYNTVIYRINRLREVYKIDLKDPETAFNLQLAIKIRELIA